MTRETHSKEALRLWLRLLSCESVMEHHVRSRLREEFGITLPQFDVLAKLDYVGKALTMSELSNQLMVSNGNITGVVDRLVRDNYVIRQPSPDDRRVQLISLSKEGAEKFAQMAREHETWVEDAFAELDIEELRQTSNLLNKASDKLKTRYGRVTA